MFRMLTTLCLLLLPFYFVCAEDSKISSDTEIKTNPGEPSGENLVEKIRALIKEYDGLEADEKRNFLANLGMTEDKFNSFRALCEFGWKSEGTYQLPQSNSTIALPKDYLLLTGKDAQDFYSLDGEPAYESIEAYACEANNLDNAIIFESFKSGYVTIDDWSEINPKNLLEEIKQNTEERNAERRKRGANELHVIGWVQKPKFLKETQTVYWAIEADSGGDESIVNSVAIRLGREGYEMITWVTLKSAYLPFGGHLDNMLSAHSFDPGYRYSDYTNGDRLAEYGVAALVAATAGGKLLKTAGILIFLKKFGYILFGGIAAAYYKLKSLFTKKKEAVKTARS